jgi:hypothetical protein
MKIGYGKGCPSMSSLVSCLQYMVLSVVSITWKRENGRQRSGRGNFRVYHIGEQRWTASFQEAAVSEGVGLGARVQHCSRVLCDEILCPV